MNIEDLLGEARPPEATVRLCLAGQLNAEYQHLSRLAAEPTSLAGDSTAARLAELREQMAAHEVEFRLRAMAPLEFKKLRLQVPNAESMAKAREDAHIEAVHEWSCRVAAATCVDPAMSPEQADRLSRRLSEAQWTVLANACYSVNAEMLEIPFSESGSEVPQPSAPPSPEPERLESASHGSLANPASNAPPSSETPAATSLAG